MCKESRGSGAEWLGPVLGSLEGEASARSLANDANYSVAHFYRRFALHAGESPMNLRRRLLLERSAYELTRTKTSVTEIAFNARFSTLEGFSRAFRRAYGVGPKNYRVLAPTEYRLGVHLAMHFAPSTVSEAPRQGELAMNLLDRVFGSHYVNMKMILARCETLTDEQLDRPVEGYFDPLPWMSSNQSLRSLLHHTIGPDSAWPGLATKGTHDTSTVRGLRSAFEENFPRFLEMVATYEKDGLWDLTFVDSECDPPIVFSYGGWIGHVIVFQAYRRIALLMALKQLGVDDVKYIDPVDYSREMR